MDKCMGQGQTDRQTRTTRIMGAISAPRKLRPSLPRALSGIWIFVSILNSLASHQREVQFASILLLFIFIWSQHISSASFSVLQMSAFPALKLVGICAPSERPRCICCIAFFLSVFTVFLLPPGHLASPLVMQMPCLKGTGAVAPRKRPLYVCTAQMRR